MAVIACQFPAVVKLMAEGSEYFGTGVFAVCPACGRIATRRRLKRYESSTARTCCGQVAETRAAGIAETVYFRTEAPLGLRRDIVRQRTVESVIMARCVRQVIAAVVADQNGAAAQGIVGIQRMIGIKDETVVFPRTDTGFHADGWLDSRFFTLQSNRTARLAHAAVGQAACAAHDDDLFVQCAVQIVGAAADGFTVVKEFGRAVHGNAVNRLTARNKLAVAGDVVAHFAVEHARRLFQHVLQGIQTLVVHLFFGDDRQGLRRFALGQADACCGGRCGNGVVGSSLFSDTLDGNCRQIDTFLRLAIFYFGCERIRRTQSQTDGKA